LRVSEDTVTTPELLALSLSVITPDELAEKIDTLPGTMPVETVPSTTILTLPTSSARFVPSAPTQVISPTTSAFCTAVFPPTVAERVLPKMTRAVLGSFEFLMIAKEEALAVVPST
jgi:hypothetical protein